MTTILMIWTVVAATRYSSAEAIHRDWRPLGEFNSMAACQEAARQLVLTNNFRCVRK